MTETTKKKTIICSAVIFIVCLWATMSFADWSQTFSEDGVYNGTTYSITKIEIFNLDDSNRNFLSPGAGNFSAGSWTVQMPNADYILATNSSTNTSNFNWLLYFTGNKGGSKLELAYLAYTSTNQVFGTYLNRNNNSWTNPTIVNLNVNDPRFDRTGAPVPVPPAIFLFSGGLLGIAALRKKIKK